MARLSLFSASLLSLLVACGAEEGQFDDAEAIGAAKVEVCHFTNGQGAYTVIDVAESSVCSHLDHGDTLFADDPDCVEDHAATCSMATSSRTCTFTANGSCTWDTDTYTCVYRPYACD